MNGRTLLLDLEGRGVQFDVVEDRLRYRGREEVLTADVVGSLRHHRCEILGILYFRDATLADWDDAVATVSSKWNDFKRQHGWAPVFDDDQDFKVETTFSESMRSLRLPAATDAVKRWRWLWLDLLAAAGASVAPNGNDNASRSEQVPGPEGEFSIGTDRNTEHVPMNVNDYLGGEHLRREDIPEATVVTVSGVSSKKFDDPPEKKLVLHFEEMEKTLVANKTNLRIATDYFGSSETDDWIGKKIVVYDDANIFFAGKKTGGLRLRAPSERDLRGAA